MGNKNTGNDVKKTKQIKFICPRGCGNYRMLNRGVDLALCQNPGCNLTMMIPARPKKTKRLQPSSVKVKVPCCTRCGISLNEVHILTIERDFSGKITDELCYTCFKNKSSEPRRMENELRKN